MCTVIQQHQSVLPRPKQKKYDSHKILVNLREILTCFQTSTRNQNSSQYTMLQCP